MPPPIHPLLLTVTKIMLGQMDSNTRHLVGHYRADQYQAVYNFLRRKSHFIGTLDLAQNWETFKANLLGLLMVCNLITILLS